MFSHQIFDRENHRGDRSKLGKAAFELQIQQYQDDGPSFIYPDSSMVKSLKFDGKDYPGSRSLIKNGLDRQERVEKVNLLKC